MIDTLIVIAMLVAPINTAKQYGDEIFWQASEQAHIRALEATKAEREIIMNFDDMRAIVNELKRKSIKLRKDNGNKS